MNKRKRVCFYLDKDEYILKGTKSACYKKIIDIDIDDMVDDVVDIVVDDVVDIVVDDVVDIVVDIVDDIDIVVDDISTFSITITPVDSSANNVLC